MTENEIDLKSMKKKVGNRIISTIRFMIGKCHDPKLDTKNLNL